MRETPAEFARRTGGAYDPPAALRALGRALAAAEACPTLFRWPGPEGLRDLFAGALPRLAPPPTPWVWLAEAPARAGRRAVERFGVVAVLQPLALAPCRVRRGEWLGVDRPLAELEVVWVPPAALRALPWDEIASAAAARAALEPAWSEAQARVAEELGAYLEELSALRRAGVPGPRLPWCELPARERRRVLAAAGVRAEWTGRRRRA